MSNPTKPTLREEVEALLNQLRRDESRFDKASKDSGAAGNGEFATIYELASYQSQKTADSLQAILDRTAE